MKTAINALEKVIRQQRRKINKLQDTIDHHERCNFMFHRLIDESEIAEKYPGYNNLPFPRLEMHINPLRENWYQMQWLYGIVYKHYDGQVLFVPIGETTGNGDYSFLKNRIELPMRDGLHIKTEMKLFNLRGFALCNGRIEEITFDSQMQSAYDRAMQEMKRI